MATMKKKDLNVERKQGGLITMPFIFGNEVGEKLAVVGFSTNMISYLTGQLHLPMTKAANTLTNFGGTGALTPLLGAFISDAFAGRFWTITIASVLLQLGMISLTISAILPSLRPPACKGGAACKEADSGQLAFLYVSLLLSALGSGGYRPCIVSFGADQFDENDPRQKVTTWKFFNWYYFCMGASILVANTVIVYIQDNAGWGWGLAVPTFAMFVSIVAFVFGYPLYRKLDPAGSPFTRLVQVSAAAYRKRKLGRVSDPSKLYENEILDAAISVGGKLVHTDSIKFLDKAAVVTEDDDPKAPNPWRLSSVHRVEELKSVIRMGPIWAAGIITITAAAQQNTFSLQQARSMDRHLGPKFQIPPASMSVFTQTSMLATIVFYDRVFVPASRKLTGLDRGVTFLARIGIGFGISLLATLAAGFVEIRRKEAAAAHGLTDHGAAAIPISVFWLAPQYCLHGVAEAFTSIGHLEFFYDQAPESMRSTAPALFWLSISAGSYTSTLLITVVHKYSAGPDGSNWLPDDNLNRGKLEYLYWLITLLQFFNLIYYIICAKMYTYKPLELRKEKDTQDGVELVGNANA
ncbi:protein NRT1/ PTR FAMILY 3.1-like [Salvia miltiorrhiza]|uniref:protein NRT1/ PTR FAMILY 3.1-like n=1 Tax=Salvia miltiorrhiza TaxID=226208 RepID=UPI0025ACDEF3|nr:protein NRT1/ PTR FAMILY 3.1-like [Salvia miltiorrhiza]